MGSVPIREYLLSMYYLPDSQGSPGNGMETPPSWSRKQSQGADALSSAAATSHCLCAPLRRVWPVPYVRDEQQTSVDGPMALAWWALGSLRPCAAARTLCKEAVLQQHCI